MTATTATIRLHADGAIRVEPFIRLTGSTHVMLLHLRRSGADPGHR